MGVAYAVLAVDGWYEQIDERESVEALHFSWWEGAPLSTALLISFCFIDFALSSINDKKKQ